MATNVDLTVTVKDEDGIPLAGCTIKVLNFAGTVVSTMTEDTAGVYTATISTNEVTPNQWRCVCRKTNYYKSAGLMIFTSATAAAQSFYMDEDLG